jgi:molybdate transport system substrate-binding protein
MRLLSRTTIVYVVIALFVVVILIGEACSTQGDRRSITVFTAASLQAPLVDIAHEYSVLNGVDVYLNVGGSMSLANQITRGAPADVFISAGSTPTARLRARNMVDSDNVRIWLTNELFMVTKLPNRFRHEGLEIVLANTVAIADPDLAPAGGYAKECLKTFGLWRQMEYTVVRSPNVRAALASVETGAADLAFIYRTDLLLSDTVEKVFECPEGSHSPIQYLVSPITRGQETTHADGFIKFLDSQYAIGIMGEHGFIVIDPLK